MECPDADAPLPGLPQFGRGGPQIRRPSGVGAAAFKCGDRDRWIGWAPSEQFRRLRYIAHNQRFLIRPATRTPHLASRVLGLSLRRLSSDWVRQFNHPILLAETFVDPSRFTGTCYKAAGWTYLGETRGFGRNGGVYYAHGQKKRLCSLRMLSPSASGVGFT